jgi:hypothetical protein
LVIKAHDIRKDFDINVAVTLKRNSQYCTYRSIDRPIWPPLTAEIVGNIYFIRV